MTLKLGLIGCGGMGIRHIHGMKQLKNVKRLSFDLVAVCDLILESANRAASIAEEELSNCPQSFTDVEKLLASGVDAVLITTVPHTHEEIGLLALDAGVHVLTEKPITLTVSQGIRLVNKASETKLKLSVAENYRRDPINRLGKALVDANIIGKIHLAVQMSASAGEVVIITPWRHQKAHGGILLDMGVHFADILEYYVGEPETVFGMNSLVDEKRIDSDGVSHPVDAEDLSVGVIRHKNGAISNWVISLAGRGESYHNRMLFGSKGSLKLPGDRNGNLMTLTIRENGQDSMIPEEELLGFVPDFSLDDTTAALFGAEQLTTYDIPFPIVDANLLAIEQAEFVDTIINDTTPEVDGLQGLRSLALTYGFLESERIGRALGLEEMLSGELDLPYQLEIEARS